MLVYKKQLYQVSYITVSVALKYLVSRFKNKVLSMLTPDVPCTQWDYTPSW